MKKKYTASLLIVGVLALSGLGYKAYQAPAPFINAYFTGTHLFDFSYEADKKLIQPYFDEAFYRKEYGGALKESGLEPIDHFLQRSTKWGGQDFDPAPWFNVTLYKYRLWPCKGNPFVDFLKQPELKVPDTAETVEVYANKDQLQRAWMAVEAFMRRQKYKVTLVLPESFKGHLPIGFQSMIARGLTVRFSQEPTLSFYHSPFIQNPDAYNVTDLPCVNKAQAKYDQMITRMRIPSGHEFTMHRLYNYTRWQKKGLINPCVINMAHYCFEPVEFSRFGRDEYTFKKSMQRLAPGFDLMLINSSIQTPNLRIVPGYMNLHLDQNEFFKYIQNREKKYELSFLLSIGGKGLFNFKTRGTFIYHYRKIIWDDESRFNLPTLFYVSARDIERFPKEMHDRVMPSFSKKWLYGSQFCIVFENSIQEDYFTEKLLECFMTLTIPIYIGCPNIRQYFDERGMIIAKDPEDVVRLANSLTPETYAAMLPYLEENKKRAEKYLNIENDEIDRFFEESMPKK